MTDLYAVAMLLVSDSVTTTGEMEISNTMVHARTGREALGFVLEDIRNNGQLDRRSLKSYSIVKYEKKVPAEDEKAREDS